MINIIFICHISIFWSGAWGYICIFPKSGDWDRYDWWFGTNLRRKVNQII
jgi:hypothetical protein